MSIFVSFIVVQGSCTMFICMISYFLPFIPGFVSHLFNFFNITLLPLNQEFGESFKLVILSQIWWYCHPPEQQPWFNLPPSCLCTKLICLLLCNRCLLYHLWTWLASVLSLFLRTPRLAYFLYTPKRWLKYFTRPYYIVWSYVS